MSAITNDCGNKALAYDISLGAILTAYAFRASAFVVAIATGVGAMVGAPALATDTGITTALLTALVAATGLIVWQQVQTANDARLAVRSLTCGWPEGVRD